MRARLLLLAAVLAAFGGSLVAGFHLDDYAIFSDPVLRSLRGPHPVTHLTFWLNYQLGGDTPWGYHAVNLLLHAGAVLLAYECLRRLLPAGAAWVAAACFALHPLQAEAVNYVAMRGVLLAGVFCLAALWAWLEDLPWLALPAFALALLADEQCALFPALLVLVGRPRKLAAAMLAMGGAAVAWGHAPGWVLASVLWRFPRLLVLPWGFTIAPQVSEPYWLALAACAALLAAFAWKWRWSAERPSADSVVTWLLAGGLLLIPASGTNPAADGRAYLALFAWAAGAGLLLARIPMRHAATVVVGVLALLSASRTFVWASDERLWREATERAPGQAGPKIELAKYVRAAEALELLNRAREQAPYNPEIPAEIGKVLLDEQQFDGAVDELSRAVALNPRNALAFNNRGVALAALGQIPAAQGDFEHALWLDANLAEARENLKRLGMR